MSANHKPEKRIFAVSKSLSKLLTDLENLEGEDRERVALLSTEQGVIAAVMAAISPKGEGLHAERKKNPKQ